MSNFIQNIKSLRDFIQRPATVLSGTQKSKFSTNQLIKLLRNFIERLPAIASLNSLRRGRAASPLSKKGIPK